MASPCTALVIVPGALRGAVTQVVRVHTHARATTAVEAWTRHVVTVQLVLAPLAVVKAVTAREDRQAVIGLRHTAVVSVLLTCLVHTHLGHSETSISKGDQQTRRYVVLLGPRGTKRKAINLIREVQAVLFEIAHRVITLTPTAVTSQLGTRGMLAERLVRFVPAVVSQVAHQSEVYAFTAVPTLEGGKEGRVGEGR
jgi:hypothetical protein